MKRAATKTDNNRDNNTRRIKITFFFMVFAYCSRAQVIMGKHTAGEINIIVQYNVAHRSIKKDICYCNENSRKKSINKVREF
jgi:hypothetical protein